MPLRSSGYSSLRRGAAAPKLRLCVSDGATIPLPDDSVDAVMSVHNVYFWAEPRTTIEEIARVLRPGGRVLLVFRGREHPLPGRLDPTIYRSVTTNDVETWLLVAGFIDIETKPTPNAPTEISFVIANLQPERALVESAAEVLGCTWGRASEREPARQRPPSIKRFTSGAATARISRPHRSASTIC